MSWRSLSCLVLNGCRRAMVVFLPWFHTAMQLCARSHFLWSDCGLLLMLCTCWHFVCDCASAFDQLAIGTGEAMRAYAKAYFNIPYLTVASSDSPSGRSLKLGFHPEHVRLFSRMMSAQSRSYSHVAAVRRYCSPTCWTQGLPYSKLSVDPRLLAPRGSQVKRVGKPRMKSRKWSP
jgi:hypothetical protein